MGVVQTYPLRVAAEAAQVPTIKYRRWMDTKIVTLRGNDARTTGSGNPCGLSRNRILQAAITEALLKKGVSLSTAAKAALEFSDSDGAGGREAGQLYPLAKTVLCLGSANGPVVSNVDFGASIFDMATDGVTICIELNGIVQYVDAVLNKFQQRKF